MFVNTRLAPARYDMYVSPHIISPALIIMLLTCTANQVKGGLINPVAVKFRARIYTNDSKPLKLHISSRPQSTGVDVSSSHSSVSVWPFTFSASGRRPQL